jgi:uncharacterized membrane-anchored protein
VIQIVIPAQMIFNQENILKTGTAYKFKTQPVDPSDPFKGKYIRLNYDINQTKTKDTVWQRGDVAYVSIANDSLGFAKATKASKEAPKTGIYIETKVNWYAKGTSVLHFTLPYNEYYMEESKAKPAEDVYRIAQRDSLPNNTYALIYVKDGDAVLDNVFINDIPIADYVEQ